MEGNGHDHGAAKPKATPVSELVGKTFSLTKLERMETKANLAMIAVKREKLAADEEQYKRIVAKRALARAGVTIADDEPLPVALTMAPDGSMVSFTVVAVEADKDGADFTVKIDKDANVAIP